ncbi:MAG: thioredoxin domain-containing protein [Pyrinomonadaceae bacterium]
MGYRKTFIASLCIFTLAALVAGQSPQAASTPASTQGKTAVLALVNGQPITLANLDAEVIRMVEGLDAQIAEARRNALDTLINEILYEVEANKRQTTIDKLLDTEAFNRIAAPAEAEVRAIYDANRAKIGTKTLTEARPEIVAYLRNQSAQKLISELNARLRASHKVVMGADINAPNLAPATVLATVAGRTVTAEALDAKARQSIYELRMQVYEAQLNALEPRINDLLLAAEAKRRNVSAQDIINAEISDKALPMTNADVNKFYEENKARLTDDLESIREDIRRYLEQQERQRLVAALAKRLREGAQLRVLLTEPELQAQAISTDDDPSRGNPQAPVTMVMFTDFQCSACAVMHPAVEEVMKANGNRVRLVVRDFPLDIHPNARKAAEAAGAANAQGKFFEYTALLYQHQSALDVPSLKKYASEVGLDRARFDRELDGGVYAAEVSRDVADGVKYEIRATPTIFINGVRLRVVTAEGLQAALERAFERVNRAAR